VVSNCRVSRPRRLQPALAFAAAAGAGPLRAVAFDGGLLEAVAFVAGVPCARALGAGCACGRCTGSARAWGRDRSRSACNRLRLGATTGASVSDFARLEWRANSGTLSLLVSSCAASFWRSVLNWAALLVARAAACPSQRCFFLRASHSRSRCARPCRVASGSAPGGATAVWRCSAAAVILHHLLDALMHVAAGLQQVLIASWSSS